MANTLGRNQNLASSFGSGARSRPDEARRRTRARPEIASVADPATPLPNTRGRKLSAEERRTLQERRRSRFSPPPPPLEATPVVTATPLLAVPAVEPAPVAAGPAPTPAIARKPAPRMPRSQERSSGMPRGLVAIGAILIAGLAVLALAGDRLFGSANDDPPTGENRALAGAGGLLPGSPVAGTPAALPQLSLAPPADATAAVAYAGERAPIVCLDPGHGGSDSGFQRVLTDAAPAMNESILVLQHAWDLEARLELQGFEVVMTRRDDLAVNGDARDVNGDGKTARDDEPGSTSYRDLDELQARINVCNGANADLLVSMHVNGHNTSEAQGFETIFTRERSFGARNELFANLAYTSLKRELAEIGYESQMPERGVIPDTALNVDTKKSTLPNIVMTGPDVAEKKIKASKMPGATVEALFVSNDYDAAVLGSPAGRAAIVTGYENAILAYFDEHPPEAR